MTPTVEFAEFDRHYGVQRHARRAVDILASSSQKEIRRTLRGHWDEAIGDEKEIAVRDNLDELLSYFGLMEIINWLDGSAYWMEPARYGAQLILSDPFVRHYYEDTYPLVLPQLLLARFEGRLPDAYTREAGREAEGNVQLLFALLELEQRRLSDNNLLDFLGLLDGYDLDGWFIEDALGKLEDRQALEKALAEDSQNKPGSRTGRLMRLVLGLDAFLRYAEDLEQLLRREEGKLAASLAWLQHSYFYGESAESVQLTFAQLQRLMARMARSRKQHLLANDRILKMEFIFSSLASRNRWLRPARDLGLGPFFEKLDPPRQVIGWEKA